MLARCLCVLKLLLRKERSMYVPSSKEKEGKGSLTYDVQYIVTDLTKGNNLLVSNIGALNI